MEYKLSISKQAILELTEIADFIASDNPQRAISFALELQQKTHEIAKNPFIYPVLKGDNTFRKKSYKGYIILYRIVDDEIEINHILNSMRDYSKLLK